MKKLLLAATAFTALSVASAQATNLNGTLVLGAAGVPTVSFSGGTVDFGASTFTSYFSGTGDFAALNGVGSLAGSMSFSTTLNAVVATSNPVLSFGTYTFTPTIVQTTAYSSTTTGGTSSKTIGLSLYGGIAGDSNTTLVTISLTQTGTSGWSYSGTLSTPATPPSVPEPASMALLGAGLLGLGLARRRRV